MTRGDDEPDTSDIPELDEAFFRAARRMEAFFCTPEHPWTPVVSGPGIVVLHPDAVEVGLPYVDWPPRESRIDRRCPNCGYEWTSELPR